MKFYKLFFLLALGTFSHSALPAAFSGLENCMCLKDRKDCEIGKLICSGEIIAGPLKLAFSESKGFEPDDDFAPFSSIRTRDYSLSPKVADFGIFASSCDGQRVSAIATFLVWVNQSPDYPILGRDTMTFNLAQNLVQKFDLSSDSNRITGECRFEAL